jgi:hypothetical protein
MTRIEIDNRLDCRMPFARIHLLRPNSLNERPPPCETLGGSLQSYTDRDAPP